MQLGKAFTPGTAAPVSDAVAVCVHVLYTAEDVLLGWNWNQNQNQNQAVSVACTLDEWKGGEGEGLSLAVFGSRL